MKKKSVAILLSFFFGWFGAHKFYLGQIGWGVVYLVLCWTYVPLIVSFIEFLMFVFMSDEKFNEKFNRNQYSDCKEIEDFFKIDINNLFKYNPDFRSSEKNSVGEDVKYYTLRLKELELSVFYELKIIEVGENEINVRFIGNSNKITSDLKSFIDFCAVKYGLDNLGHGKVEQKDYFSAERNVFSRMWNKVRISNMDSNKMEMTIYSLPKTK